MECSYLGSHNIFLRHNPRKRLNKAVLKDIGRVYRKRLGRTIRINDSKSIMRVIDKGWNQKKVVDLGNNSFEGLPYYPVTDQFEEGGS